MAGSRGWILTGSAWLLARNEMIVAQVAAVIVADAGVEFVGHFLISITW